MIAFIFGCIISRSEHFQAAAHSKPGERVKEKVKEKTIDELIYEETDQRLKEMASPEYVFPEKADRKDAIGILASIGVCLLLIILCMTGVIE